MSQLLHTCIDIDNKDFYQKRKIQQPVNKGSIAGVTYEVTLVPLGRFERKASLFVGTLAPVQHEQ